MAWSPGQYLKFDAERTRPARELLVRVPFEKAARVVDLGCGPGNSTELLIERFGVENVVGLDNDANMLEAARRRLPGVRFFEADVASWCPEEPTDLLFANAVLQWVPDHLDVLDRLMDCLAPGGALAVQMPDNLTEPSHVLMEETARTGPWREIFAKEGVRRVPLPPLSAYYNRLIPKASSIDIWHTAYNHRLEDAAAIVEWVKSTGLRRYLDCLNPDQFAPFEAAYHTRIANAYPPLIDGRVLLRFPRLFLVAVKS